MWTGAKGKKLEIIQCFAHLSRIYLEMLVKNKFPGPSPADSGSVGWSEIRICLFDNLSDVVS